MLVLIAGFLGAAGAFAQCSGCKDAAACKVESAVKGISETNTASEQKTCPVMGAPINKEIYTDYNGKRIYFCCKGCVATFNKDPQKYLDKMSKDGVTLTDAPCDSCASKGMEHGKATEGSCASCKEKAEQVKQAEKK